VTPPQARHLLFAYRDALGRSLVSGQLSDAGAAVRGAPCVARSTVRPGTDMNHQSHSIYRGCAIITRSIEVPPLSGWAELAASPSTWTRRFAASFSVDHPDDALTDSWQQFPTARFDTRLLASENALSEARRSIDLRLAEA
jgi:hypothetical protein